MLKKILRELKQQKEMKKRIPADLPRSEAPAGRFYGEKEIRISIIGAGRLGTSLGIALSHKGFLIRWFADKSLSAAQESRRLTGLGKATTDIVKAAREADVVFLCVPDEGIAKTAKKIAGSREEWQGMFVYHTSGVLPSEALAALRAEGASCASFHPVQSFPRKNMPAAHFKNIYIGLEGDPKALSLAKKIIRKLGAFPLFIKEQDKITYHAACSIASNLSILLFDMAGALLRSIGIQNDKAVKILLPLVQGTLQNVKHFGGVEALTGPLARGDTETVRRHLEALKSFPAARKAYQILGARALELAEKKNIPLNKIKILKNLLEEK